MSPRKIEGKLIYGMQSIHTMEANLEWYPILKDYLLEFEKFKNFHNIIHLFIH